MLPPRHNLDALFAPRSVALVGVSERPGHWSVRVWGNLARLGFKGAVYPVNPGRNEIWGTRCYPSLDALPEAPDHLALFVPADVSLEMLTEGGRLGARSATLFAAGFGEGGDTTGVARAAELRDVLKRTGILAAGPNCMGIACGRSGFVTLADETLQPLARGPVAVITQSGMLASTFSRALNDRGLGVSHLISCGNQIGLTLASYIEHLTADDAVEVIICYIEMLPDAGRFLVAAANAYARGKRVVVVKIGGSERARAAALAHTGAMVGTLDAFDAVTARSGVMRVGSLEETIEAAELFSRAPGLSGRRVAFITNSGALKTLISETAERHGVKLALLDGAATDGIKAALGPDATPTNPLDTKQTLPADAYIACVDAVGRAPGVDLILMLEELPRETGVARKVANFTALHRWAALHGDGRAAAAVLSPLAFADTAAMTALRADLPGLPLLRGLDTTMRMLARLPDAPELIHVPTPATATQTSAARDIIQIASSLAGPTALNEPQSKALLAAYGVPLPREAVVETINEAVAAAHRIGFPVVMKAVSAGVPHKSDAGLVLLDITDGAGAADAAALIETRCRALGVQLEGILVGQQVKGGIEMVLGVNRDAEMGLVMMVGLGGVWLEVIRDVAFAPAGLDASAARRVIAGTKAHQLLTGLRGATPSDIGALAEAMAALSRLALDLGNCLQSIDINPIVVLNDGKGTIALDALVVLRPSS
jgi:acetate---CoA ligase (ADP-forming)